MSGSDESEPETRVEKPARSSKPKIDVDFGPRYRVIGLLGKGGMGVVYRAYDTELRAEVALKVVSTDNDAGVERFRREIALARKVTSANVLRVYDLDEHEGLRFLSMEYVDGRDLGALLRDGRLPQERALSIFRQTAQGLVAAHEQGVVHRDLKPQNVLIDKEDRVRVADFGLARSIGESGMTASGAILGSPAYMSPEQVKGEDVDERSDIYSLGVLLYQLVSGHTPFQASTPHAVMEMRLHKKPPPLRDVEPTAPAQIEAIVARCLRVAPQERYPSVRALLADLDAPAKPRRSSRTPWLGAVAAIVAVTATAVAWKLTRPAPEAVATREPAVRSASGSAAPQINGPVRLLVLGIQNRAVDPSLDATADELFRTALRRSTKIDPLEGFETRELGAELGVELVSSDGKLVPAAAARLGANALVLSGAVVSKGAAFAVTMRVTDANGGVVLERSEDAPTAAAVVPAIGRLASALREHLGDSIPSDERERTSMSLNIEADHELAVGQALNKAGHKAEAIEHMKRAIELDPTFSLAHGALARMLYSAMKLTEARREFDLAFRTVEQLGERDRLATFASYYLATDESERAIETYRALLAKWPSDVAALNNLIQALLAAHQMQKAWELQQTLTQRYARNLSTRGNYVASAISVSQFETAVDAVDKVFADFPKPYPALHVYRAIAHVMLGHRAEARDAYAAYTKVDASLGPAAEGDLAIAEGRYTDAFRTIEPTTAQDRAAKQDDALDLKYTMLAYAHMRRGDRAEALAAAAKVTHTPDRLIDAALVQADLGDDARARTTAAALAKDVGDDAHAYAKLIEGELLRVHRDPHGALEQFKAALRIADCWQAHLLLARAALDAGQFPEAYTELKTLAARRGEIVLGIDDAPNLRAWPQVLYYLARAQEGMGSVEAQATYKQFLALLANAEHDALVDDARQRVH